MRLAIIENNTVVNVILCDSLELAKELTGASEVLDSDAVGIHMNYFRIDGIWFPPSPYPSWILDKESQNWNPPVPYPADGGVYEWAENTQSWVEMSGTISQ